MKILGIVFIVLSILNFTATVFEWLMTSNLMYIHLISAVLFGILGVYWIDRANRKEKSRKLHDKHRRQLLEKQKGVS